MEVLDCSICAADEDSAIEVLVGAVFVHLTETFTAAAPLALEADVDEVCHVLAELALTYEVTHLAQSFRKGDEEISRVVEFEMEGWGFF